MQRVAFYAPMKPPGHPVPSGDREMARNLIRAIGTRARVDLVSDLQVHDARGNGDFQRDMQARATHEAGRLIRALAGSDTRLWVTYHSYYKSPDMIGPAVCRALNLPYVLIECSRARSRLSGPWAGYARAAEDAADAADVIFYMTALDRITLERDRPAHQRLVRLRPFLPLETLPPEGDGASGAILAVGMMRARDKLDSYRLIARTLPRLRGDWRLEIAGDGPARAQVEEMMAPFAPRVTFLGQLDRDGLARAYGGASVFFWPGVNEAYGMVYLEAQAAGLPVVAQDRDGVRDVVLAGTLAPPGAGPEAMAREIALLLDNPDLRQKRGREGRSRIRQDHLIATAAETFWSAVQPLPENRP